MLGPSLGVILGLAAGARSLSPLYLPCQVQKPAHLSPLLDCPPGTVYVSPNDTRAQFKSVQHAILSLKEGWPATILIGAGEYKEAINITRKAPLTLLGQLPPDTRLSSTANASALNLVTIWNNTYQDGIDDALTSVLTVAPNGAGALIGAGVTGAPLQPEFGNVDFKAYNLNVENRAANYSISQALATDISYANASFYGCAFASYQDTWYTGRNGSTYVVDSIIYGQTDYLFGFGTAWFQNIILANRACGGGIVAWKGTNYSDSAINAPGNRYGAYINNSIIMRSPDANATAVTDDHCYLGRPWNNNSTTVYMNTYMDDSVNTTGFTTFDTPSFAPSVYYAEYNSTGPHGAATYADRMSIEHILDVAQLDAADFTIDGVFLERPKWIDYTYIY